jgi:hypothetical protein
MLELLKLHSVELGVLDVGMQEIIVMNVLKDIY